MRYLLFLLLLLLSFTAFAQSSEFWVASDGSYHASGSAACDQNVSIRMTQLGPNPPVCQSNYSPVSQDRYVCDFIRGGTASYPCIYNTSAGVAQKGSCPPSNYFNGTSCVIILDCDPASSGFSGYAACDMDEPPCGSPGRPWGMSDGCMNPPPPEDECTAPKIPDGNGGCVCPVGYHPSGDSCEPDDYNDCNLRSTISPTDVSNAPPFFCYNACLYGLTGGAYVSTGRQCETEPPPGCTGNYWTDSEGNEHCVPGEPPDNCLSGYTDPHTDQVVCLEGEDNDDTSSGEQGPGPDPNNPGENPGEEEGEGESNGSGGQCTITGQTKNADGVCACPTGQSVVNGSCAASSNTCTPPLVLNLNGSACVQARTCIVGFTRDPITGICEHNNRGPCPTLQHQVTASDGTKSCVANQTDGNSSDNSNGGNAWGPGDDEGTFGEGYPGLETARTDFQNAITNGSSSLRAVITANWTQTTGSLPCYPSIIVLGQEISICFSDYQQHLTGFGSALVAVSLVLAFYIILSRK